MLQRAFEIRPRGSNTIAYPAPTAGWVQSGNVVQAPLNQAEVLDNFIPTAQGARLRGGCQEYADLGAAVIRMFTYVSGSVTKLFASTASKVFDAGRVSSGVNTFAELEGVASGDWSATQISTSGGQFTVAVNGSDHAVYWDGTEFNPITAEAINEIPFDAETAAFAVGETVTGGTSGATAEILAITKTSATAGKLKVGAITSGPFQDNEALTDGATGAATAAGASASASAITITNVTTNLLSQVWLFKERLFFVEKGTSSVWYLPVESIGGAAVEIDLGSVFSKGGNVLFGARWSLDSGSGLDDVCLFFSDRGEVAVYEGTDPSSATTWSLAGVYEIGDPLNKHGFFKAGGDLAVVTKDGIVPISAAIAKDRAGLQLSAITYPIEDAWRDAIEGATASDPVSVVLWQSGRLLLVGTPQTTGGNPVSFIANARTGAWCRVTGWDVTCGEVVDDTLYFGSPNGKVYLADSGGSDDGVAYTGVYVPKFQPANVFGTSNAAALTYRSTERITFSMSAHADYTVGDIPSPQPSFTTGGDTWGTGVWGTFVWGSSSSLQSFTEWQAVASSGYAHAPGVAITSNQVSPIVFEIQVTRLRVEGGYAL